MIEQHYAGVIENWDGQRVPAEQQIRAARSASGRSMDVPSDAQGKMQCCELPANG